MKNTLELKDIVNNFTFHEIAPKIYEEPLAQQFERCFSYHSDEEVELNSGKTFFLKIGNDLKIFVHAKGDTLWFTGFWEFPYEVSTVTLDIAKQQNYTFAGLELMEIGLVQYSKPYLPCANGGKGFVEEHELFIQCCKESLWKSIVVKINCTVADMKQIIPNHSTMPECNNRVDADQAYWAFIELLAKFTPKLWEFGCPIPCRRVKYQLKFIYYHKNNLYHPEMMSNFSEGHILFYPFWSPFPEEERIESAEYDLASLLVSAGGNLSLFLGFSCLSVLFGIIDWIQARF